MIEIVQNMPTFPPALRVGLVGLWNLHGANQGSGIVYDESCNGEPANGAFVGRPALHFAPTGIDIHHLTPATAADNIPFFGDTGSRTMVVEIRPDTPLTSGFLALAAPFPQLYLTDERKIAFRYIGVDETEYTITHPHIIADGVRACVKIVINISGTGVVTLHVDDCTYPTSIDETGIIAEPISDWNHYHPTLNSADITLIGGQLRAYVTSMAWFSGELSADESIMLSRFPLHYMQSDFGGKLIDGMPFNEGTGATLSTKAGRTWYISGATWDVGTHGGQTWTRANGNSGDRFQGGGAEQRFTPAVVLGQPAKLDWTPQVDARTIAIYCRSNVPHQRYVVTKSAASTAANRQLYWIVGPNGITFRLGGTVQKLSSGPAAGSNVSMVLALPAAATGAKVYVNTALMPWADGSSGDIGTATNAADWIIGNSRPEDPNSGLSSTTGWEGTIYAVAMWNYVLPEQLIALLHQFWRSKYGA
jgi:hypothetical protein